MLLTACMAIVIASCAISVKKYARFMPEGMRECSLCHTLDNRGLPSDKGRELVDSIEEMCSDCHTERIKEGEHQVGVVQKRDTALPIYNGVVACMSCHEPHGIGGNHAMLRLPPELLCAACHDF